MLIAEARSDICADVAAQGAAIVANQLRTQLSLKHPTSQIARDLLRHSAVRAMPSYSPASI
jgi:hypothetical protein